MKKRIVICADGTWNRPEKDLKKDFPTNVLRLARAIQPVGADGVPQQVFYDWGVGSYYDAVIGGATGRGLEKNVMDDYRYIVQNYSPGDDIFLFGFSRGAYTVRSLCGLINNCGILKRPEARLIEEAFALYKKPTKAYAPNARSTAPSTTARARYWSTPACSSPGRATPNTVHPICWPIWKRTVRCGRRWFPRGHYTTEPLCLLL